MQRPSITAWYTPVPAPAALDDVLVCSWTAAPDGVHRLTPDGCCDLLWISGRGVVLCGPETASWTFALPAGTSAVGVRFRPGVASVVFGPDATEWLDRRGPLAVMVPALADDVAALDDALSRIDDTTECLRALEQFVAGLSWPEREVEQCNRLTHLLTVAPERSVAAVAAELGWSQRHLHRMVRRRYGYGIATLARLMRFQRVLAHVDAHAVGDTLTLAGLAASAGYADQAHLARDCRAITGLTPTAFLGEWFATFPDMSDPYKTGARFVVTLGA